MGKDDKLKCYTLKAPSDGHRYVTCDDKGKKGEKPKPKKLKLRIKTPKEAATDAMTAIKEVKNMSGNPKLKKQFIEKVRAELDEPSPNTTAKPKSPLRGGVGLRPEISKLVNDFARPRGARRILFDDKTFDIYKPKSWSFKQFKKIISTSGFLPRVGERIEEQARGEYMGRYPVNHAGDYLYRLYGEPSNVEEGGTLQKKEYENFKLNLEKYLWRLIKHPVYQNRIINEDLYNVPFDDLHKFYDDEDYGDKLTDLNWMITGFHGLDYLFKTDVISQMNYLMDTEPRFGLGLTDEEWLKKPPFSGRVIRGKKGMLESLFLGGASALNSKTSKDFTKLKKRLPFFRKYGSLKNS